MAIEAPALSSEAATAPSTSQQPAPGAQHKPGRLTVVDGALMGAGMLCVSGAALFYRQKRTTPFKLAYFLSWPVLGTAILKVFGPDRSEMERELRTRGLDAQQLEANRQMTQLQMARLRDVAKEGKEN